MGKLNKIYLHTFTLLNEVVVRDQRYFTQEEAHALVGRPVRCRVRRAGVPKETTGRVIQTREGPYGWFVAIQWDVLNRRSGKPMMDWVDRYEYLKGVEELPPA